ncbi:MAG: GNAT family N-acetyltransferase [Candidatus Margulisiibacteriota bacterium]
MTIHAAQKKDHDAIIKIMAELELDYPSQSFDGFWIAENDSGIIGIAKLEDLGDLMFLSSVGVIKKEQHKGIAKGFLKHLLKSVKKDVYIYTTIPEFFEGLDFKRTASRSDLPSKTTFSCKECTPEICVTMVKHYDGA